MDEKKIIEALKRWGADTDGAIARMLDDESMYVMLLKKYKDSFRLGELKELIAAGKVDSAYELSHMLKGMLGNLGLTPMYESIIKIVEPLRKKNIDNLLPEADRLIKLKAELDAIVNS